METGTIIHGTLLPYDLIEAFTAELESRDLDGFHRATITTGQGCVALGVALGADAVNYPDNPNDADDFSAVVCDLMDALNDMAPEGCYFGAHEGDGSDFGYWPLEED